MKAEILKGYRKLDQKRAVAGAAKCLELWGDTIALNCDAIRPELVAHRIYKESRNNPAALSREGEIGLLQLYPRTVKKYQVDDPYDPVQNIRAGCKLWNNWSAVLAKSYDKRGVGHLAYEPGYLQSWGWQGMCWLETSIGPGATPFLARIAEPSMGRPFEDIVAWLATPGSDDEMRAYSRRWGSQSPELVAQRVGSAMSSVDAAMSMGSDGPLLAGMAAAALFF